MPTKQTPPSREIMRIIDANLNRCREALRVVEEVFRLGLSDKEVSTEIKRLRHDLAAIARELGRAGGGLLGARDSANDVGRELVVRNQKRAYAGMADMASANIKRAEEALRVLAETARLAASTLAPRFERMRFEVYEIERKHLPRLSRRSRLENVLLYSLVTSAISPIPLPSMVKILVDGGVDAIQLREKTMPDGAFARLAEKVGGVCRKGGALFIVNDRADVAAAVGADGVHLGQDDLPPACARKIMGERGIIGVTTRNLAMAKKALAGGADYIAIGPAFKSQIAPEKEAIGPAAAGLATRMLDAPAFAIGGVTASRLPLVLKAGCRRIAVCTALLWAKNPEAEARKFKQILKANFQKVSRE
jgi:thiamine-phosphate pyrophosphorylase